MDCVVRDARDEDLVAVHAIYRHHVLHGLASFEEEPPGIEELRRRRAAVLDSTLPYLVAETDGVVSGYCYAAPYRSRSAYRFTVEDSVYVDHRFTGRGIGTSLLEALIVRCEAGPWRQIIAVIGDSSNSASIALHRRLGFRAVGTLDAAGFKFGRWVDVVLMQRMLGEGGGTPPSEA
jgi:L-amino acid N-acyltransferase YncA